MQRRRRTNDVFFHYINIPAIDALNSDASIPAATARTPKRAISGRRDGAISPRPPSKIANELEFANPHNAKLMTITVFGDNVSITSVNDAYATNSFNTSFCPIKLPAVNASDHGTPMANANGEKINPKMLSSESELCPKSPQINPNKPFSIAINAINANNIAPTFNANFKPSLA